MNLLDLPPELLCVILVYTEEDIFFCNMLSREIGKLIAAFGLYKSIGVLRCFYDAFASPRCTAKPGHLLQLAATVVEWDGRSVPFNPATLYKLTPSLTALSLENIDVYQDGGLSVLSQLTNLTKLQCSELEGRRINKRTPPLLDIGPLLAPLTKLQYLNIDDTCGSLTLCSPSDTLRHLTGLVHLNLDLYDCPIKPRHVRHLTNLQHLWMESDLLGPALNLLPSLTALYLPWGMNHALLPTSFLEPRIKLWWDFKMPDLFGHRTHFCLGDPHWPSSSEESGDDDDSSSSSSDVSDDDL